MQDTQAASRPMTGSYTIAIGNFCDTVELTVGEPAESVQAKVEALPSVEGGVDVSVAGSVHDSLTYTITFPGSAGAVPSLRVVDSSKLGGSQPTVTASLVQSGSSELFYGPVPGELLRVPVASSNTIQLEVNGVPSACGTTYEGTSGLVPGRTIAANASAACRFQASTLATPVLSNVVPNGTIVPINMLVRGNIAAPSCPNTLLNASVQYGCLCICEYKLLQQELCA